jgi:hypothetical protein
MIVRIELFLALLSLLILGGNLTLDALDQQVSRREAQESVSDEYIHDTFQHLCSSDKIERKTAKQRIMEVGPKAIHPLLVLLRDLLSNSGAGCVTDKAGDGDKDIETSDKRDKPERSSRLKEDVIDLLVRLQAKEAVDLLVVVMLEDFHSSGMGRGVGLPGMRALIKLGCVGVPNLLEILETPETVTLSLPLKFQATDEQRQAIVRSQGPLIQTLIASVLGEIGDVRALPTLERLSTNISDENVIYFVKAINQIREKAK